MIDLRKNTDKPYSDKELYDQHIESLIRENTDPKLMHARHIQQLRKEYEESLIDTVLFQDTIDGPHEFNI
jgi:ATP-dependent Zn protease